MYYDKVMFSISGNNMDPLLRLKFVSECVMFCFSGCYFLLLHDLLKCLIKTFAAVSIPQGIGNLLSLLSRMSEGGHKKGWVWFKLTTRETKRSDKTKYE